MTHVPHFLSPESREEIDNLMKPLREAKTREERDEAREKINSEVLEESKTAWVHITKEDKEE